SSAIGYFSNKTDIDNNISNFKTLLQDMFKSYIYNYCIEIKYDSKFFSDTRLKENKIFHIEVLNQSDMVLKDVTLDLVMKPKNRIALKIIKSPNHKDLNRKLEWEIELTGKTAGKANFSIQLAIKDPFIENNTLNYKKKLGVMAIIEK
ncbi:unnamed protein product, partial [marine sediment metagenome]